MAADRWLRSRFPVLQDRADIIADGVQRAWRSRHTQDPNYGFETWFAAIVRNAARDHVINASRLSFVSLESVSESEMAGLRPGEVDPLELVEPFDERLVGALMSMSERQRQVLLLRAVDDLSSREVGALLAMDPGAVDVAFHRARRAMRLRLGAVKALIVLAVGRALDWLWRSSCRLQLSLDRAGITPMHHLHAIRLSARL